MYYYEGYSFQEISVAIGVSEAAVRQRLSRARKSLKEAVINNSCMEYRSV